jgi:tetratricopeptide (TPR) repeat protein
VLVALGAGAFLAGLTPISDGDIFWHLAAGREMAHRHAWLHTDPFTLSAAGRPWIDVHWLFQLACHGIYRLGGLAGVVLAKALLVAAGALVLGRAVGRSGGATARALFVPAMVGVLYLARHFLLARPVIVSLLMLALFFAALERLRAGRRRALIALPLLQIVWSNCQGLAVLGPAMIGAYLIAAGLSPRLGGRRWWWPFDPQENLPWRPLALTLALCVAASLVNPYGRDGVTLATRLLARISPSAGNLFGEQVAENVPPWLLERTAPAQIFHFKWYLATLAACLALAGRRLLLSHLLLLGGFGALALMANRNVLLFYWVATPIAILAIAPRVARLLAKPPRASRSWVIPGALALGVVLAAELALAAVSARREPTIAAPTPFHFPTESTRRLVGAGAHGPVFVPDHAGGYLAFSAPGLKPYIDTRLLLHTADEYATYLAAVDDPARFDALAARWRFRYVALTTAYPDRYLGLVQHLAKSPAWTLTFTDGSEVLFARRDPAGDGAASPAAVSPRPLDSDQEVDRITAQLAARFSRWPDQHQAARLHLARLLLVLGQVDQAQRVLATMTGPTAVQLRARAYLAAGQAAAAESLARTLLLVDPRDVSSLTLMARIAMRSRQPDAALGWLRRALEADPYDGEALRLLESLSDAASTDPASDAKSMSRN